MSKTSTSVWSLRRNDVDACVSYYEEHGVTSAESAVMIQLQDDPSRLLRLMKSWKTKS